MIRESKNNHILSIVGVFTVLILCFGCSSEKFIAPNQSVLSSISITSDNKQIEAENFKNYIRQTPNSKWFGLVKVPLSIYTLSGKDSTNWLNKVLRNIGEAPVVYDSTRADLSVSILKTALFNRGYFHSNVDYKVTTKKKKTSVEYHLKPGELFFVDSFKIEIKNKGYKQVLENTIKKSLIYKGMPCNANRINEERHRIVSTLQDSGYYFANEHQFYFRVDTLKNYRFVTLTLLEAETQERDYLYQKYSIDSVNVFCNLNELDSNRIEKKINNTYFVSNDHFFLTPKCIFNNIFFKAKETYCQNKIKNTYNNINSLGAVRYSVIRFDTIADKKNKLNCSIYINPNKPNNFSTEIEGTNTAGDLGAAATITYSNRNLFRGSEILSLKVRGAFENITGLEGYQDEDYIEFNSELNLKFPNLLIPFLKQDFKNSLNSSSEARFSYDTQNRPEFHRRVLSGTWGYSWRKFYKPSRHQLDLLSINYVFMPWISQTFRQNYLENEDSRYSILRYSYENLFIIRTRYNYLYNSLNKYGSNSLLQTNAYQIKFGIELAGNSPYLFSSMLNAKKDSYNQYTLFNVAFSQYAKFDFDYVKSFLIDSKNSLATHFNFGIAVPYGNSTIIPYEKRYFTGGANGIRGWSVRTLGPGKYVEKDGNINFINQTGNLKLLFNIEYRTQLFKKIHGAFFIDAGNIWTTRNYPDQPGGQFHFDNFYKQIAVSYGIGLRLNVDYFILRFDGGVKAINPSYTTFKEHYPLLKPNFSRDFTFHFAVGMPF